MSSVAKASESPSPTEDETAETSMVVQVPRSVIPLLHGSTVIVKSGDGAWLLSTDLLKSHSKFFDKLLTGDHGLKEIDLPRELDCGAFSLFVDYILTGHCYGHSGSADWNSDDLEPKGLSLSSTLQVLWANKAAIWLHVLAFRLGASKLMNHTIQGIYARWTRLPNNNALFEPYLHAKVASYACESWQGQTSPLKDLVYHFIFENWKRKGWIEDSTEAWEAFFQHHPEVCVRLTMAFNQSPTRRREGNEKSRNLELYLVKD